MKIDAGTKQALLSAMRSLLIAAGAWFAGQGYIGADMVPEITGAVMVIVPTAWGVWQKYRSEHQTKDRETVAVQAGVNATRAGGMLPVIHVAPVEAQAILKEHKMLVRVGDEITWQ